MKNKTFKKHDLIKSISYRLNMNYDESKKVFRGGLGPDIIESDFDIDSYIKDSQLGSGNETVVRSRRRGRAKF